MANMKTETKRMSKQVGLGSTAVAAMIFMSACEEAPQQVAQNQSPIVQAQEGRFMTAAEEEQDFENWAYFNSDYLDTSGKTALAYASTPVPGSAAATTAASTHNSGGNNFMLWYMLGRMNSSPSVVYYPSSGYYGGYGHYGSYGRTYTSISPKNFRDSHAYKAYANTIRTVAAQRGGFGSSSMKSAISSTVSSSPVKASSSSHSVSSVSRGGFGGSSAGHGGGSSS